MNGRAKDGLALQVKVAVLSALSFLLMLVPPIPLFPPAPFLKYEPSDIPALVGGLLFGPRAGIAVIAVKSLLMIIYRFDPINVVGTGMDALAAVLLVGFATWFAEKYPRRMVQGLIISVVGMIVLMMLPNFLIFDAFMKLLGGGSTITATNYVFLCCTPFNAIKGTLTAVVGYAIYKRVAARG